MGRTYSSFKNVGAPDRAPGPYRTEPGAIGKRLFTPGYSAIGQSKSNGYYSGLTIKVKRNSGFGLAFAPAGA